MSFYDVAVLIPAFEMASQLQRTLDCLLCQHGKFQIVIVDDSVSNSVQWVCEGYRRILDRKYTDIKYIRRSFRPGFRVASAWNILWQSADVPSDGILILTNSHILMRPDWIARHIAHHKGQDDICVIGPYHEGSWDAPSTSGQWDDAGREDKKFTLLRCYSDSVRKKHIAAIGGWDETFDGYWGWEDTDFAYRLGRSGVQFVRGTDVPVVHLTHPSNVPEDTRGQRNKQVFLAKHPYFRKWIEG